MSKPNFEDFIKFEQKLGQDLENNNDLKQAFIADPKKFLKEKYDIEVAPDIEIKINNLFDNKTLNITVPSSEDYTGVLW